MATARDLITQALKELGVLGEGVDLTAEAGADGLVIFNDLLDQLKAEGGQFFTITRTVANIVASQNSYTVGSGGDINIPRPVRPVRVNYQITSTTPNQEYPLGDLLTEQEYEAIPMKNMEGVYPIRAYYNPTYAATTHYAALKPWPVPTGSSLQWVFYHWAQIAEAANLSTEMEVPPGYREYFKTQLAERFAAPWGRPIPPSLAKRISTAKKIVERANFRMAELTYPEEAMVGRRGMYDIKTDQ